MVDLEHPCRNGLTPECFTKYPAWAKRAFAYRLMHTLFPGRRSRLLPRWLRDPLIGEGAEIPPGVVVPPGVAIPPWFPWDAAWLYWWYLDFEPWLDPEKAFPPGWTPGDPLPPGVEVKPIVIFPPGWTPGDPLPPGVEIPPGVAFPPGWTPDDPLPPGVEVDTGVLFPPGWTPGDPLPPPSLSPPGYPEDAPEAPEPPLYLPLWMPGPPHRPYPSPAPAEPPWSYDAFETLDPIVWSKWDGADGTPEAVSGKLRMKTTTAASDCGIYRFGPVVVPTEFNITIPLNYASGTGSMYFQLLTGTHHVEIGWVPPNKIWLKKHPAGTEEYSVAWAPGLEYTWKLFIVNGWCSVTRGDDVVVTNHYFREYTPMPGYMEFYQWDPAETFVDSLLIEDMT